MDKSIPEIVDKLNDMIWGENAEHEENFDVSFSYKYNTTYEQIYFEDILIWCSNNEERTFIEDINDYEDLYTFCVKKFYEISKRFNKLYQYLNNK